MHNTMDKYYFKEMSLYFPSIAERAVDAYMINDFELIVLINDRSVMSYDPLEKTIRQVCKDKTNISDEEFKRDFARRLRLVLYRKNISRDYLLQETDISKTTISNYCNGKTMITVNNLYKILKAINCSIDELVFM